MKNNNEIGKLNDKGFSLVELIIVIAIMAILVGVLAPQYLRYVERARESADLNTMDTLISAVEIYSVDPEFKPVEGTIKCVNGALTPSGDVGTKGHVKDALNEAGLNRTITLKSKRYQNFTITFTASSITFSGGDTDGDELQAALGR